MTTVRKNERSWAIELISQINQFSSNNDLIIKRAGGESTISERRGQSMFPDVILYGDTDLSSILQGWELKMPDVPITDCDFVDDAQRKAKALNLHSCVIWNFTYAKLYIYDDQEECFTIRNEWTNNKIQSRDDVGLYRATWEKTLREVLLTINEYLITGDIKKSSLGSILTNISISKLVNENKGIVAGFIRENANRDSIMEAYIDNWWKEVQLEYEKDETDKYIAYAKNIIINWSNRIVFAHLIKRRQSVAFAIDKLDYSCTIDKGNKIFSEITNKSDFYNVFGSIPYNDIMPKQTWYALIDLSLFIKDSPIDEISQPILQQVLEESVNVSRRLVNGQYPTPPILAKILSRITIHNAYGECFDGCCGTGTIPSYIINYKKDKFGISHAVATTWACDKFQMPLQIANLAMTDYDAINKPCRLFKKDILALMPGEKVEIVNPQNGDRELFDLPEFDAFISNLPFIKSREISEDELPYINRIKLENGLSGRSDFSYYVALHIAELVKEGGYVGVILSNSFLGTEAGSLFIRAIRESFDDIKIHISGNGRWFQNADIVTVLLVMRKKKKNLVNQNVSFFTWKQNLNLITTNVDIQNTIINSSILDKEINQSVISRVNYSDEEIAGLRNLNVSFNSLFTNLKWLLDIVDKIAPISMFFNVFRGSRRGWDKMFFPDVDNTIESLFLKDVLMNARSTDKYIAYPDRKAFCCSLSLEELKESGYKGALSWIQKFERETNETGKPLPQVLARAGIYWYELPVDEIAEVFTMMNPDNRMFYSKFTTPTFVNQRLVGLRRKREQDDLDLLHALLNSFFSLFYIEAVGFGRGLGVLDINKDAISKCYILNPELLTKSQKEEIKDSFKELEKRGIVEIDQEFNDPIRKKFEMTVLKAYGIEMYYNEIVNSLKSMRRIRKAAIINRIAIPDNNNVQDYNTLDNYSISEQIAAESYGRCQK